MRFYLLILILSFWGCSKQIFKCENKNTYPKLCKQSGLLLKTRYDQYFFVPLKDDVIIPDSNYLSALVKESYHTIYFAPSSFIFPTIYKYTEKTYVEIPDKSNKIKYSKEYFYVVPVCLTFEILKNQSYLDKETRRNKKIVFYINDIRKQLLLHSELFLNDSLVEILVNRSNCR